jgi:DNA polymerase I
LLGGLTYFGLDVMDAAEKADLQEAIGNGTWRGRYTPEEILDYCEGDVAALANLLPAMAPYIDLQRALLRGRYMAAASAMEHAGTPIDVAMLDRLRQDWTDIQDRLIAEIDKDYGVYDGRVLKNDRFERLLAAEGIPWARTSTGRLDMSDEFFRQQARVYPRIAPLRELRSSLSELRLSDLAVGRDGRNRTMLSAFRSRTSRNQPSNSKFIFGPSVWLRGLIKPPAGHAIAHIDWVAQEVGIAAALSGDAALMEAYRSGDVYLGFGKQAHIIPDLRQRKRTAPSVSY